MDCSLLGQNSIFKLVLIYRISNGMDFGRMEEGLVFPFQLWGNRVGLEGQDGVLKE